MTTKPVSCIERIFTVKHLCSLLGLSEKQIRSYIINIEKNCTIIFEEKKSGGQREITAPSNDFKKLLQAINRKILTKVDFPDYLHGSLKGRSAASNAEAHLNSRVLLSLDIVDFFPSVTRNHIEHILKYFFKFHEKVASLLADITSFRNRLPQGFPTSSTIANLVFWKFEHSLVEKLEQRGFRYTRFLDDISVSTAKKYKKIDLENTISDCVSFVGRLGFKLHRNRQGKFQILTYDSPKIVTGMLASETISLPPEVIQECRQIYHQLKEGPINTSLYRSFRGKAFRIMSILPELKEEFGSMIDELTIKTYG